MSKDKTMNTPWEYWKRAFYAWETQTAQYLEELLKNPVVLKPSGKLLGNMMRGRAASDKIMTNVWGMMGLPTKRDQERTLHALNQLQSRLYDLEERLEELSERDEAR